MELIESEFKGFYVSKCGKVIGKRGNELKGSIDRNGYVQLCLSVNGGCKSVLAHRMILKTLNPVDGMDGLDVNHKNGIKNDNRIENLEWCTRSENIIHSFRNSLQTNITNQYGNFKVVTNDVIELIKENMLQHTTKELSDMVGFSEKTIRKYKNKIRNGEV